jgi:hypothetical protein
MNEERREIKYLYNAHVQLEFGPLVWGFRCGNCGNWHQGQGEEEMHQAIRKRTMCPK